MSIKPENLVQYAYEIYKANQNSVDCEIQLRTAVNRAYYGAFLMARDLAGITTSSGSVHRDVAEFYYKDKETRIVRNNLHSLKRLRGIADYRLNDKIKINDAKTSCSTALRTVKKLNSLAQK